MEEKKQDKAAENPAPTKPDDKKACSDKGFCYCRAVAAALIIALVWWAPSWANIAITVLAVLIILGSGNCSCRTKGLIKK